MECRLSAYHCDASHNDVTVCNAPCTSLKGNENTYLKVIGGGGSVGNPIVSKKMVKHTVNRYLTVRSLSEHAVRCGKRYTRW